MTAKTAAFTPPAHTLVTPGPYRREEYFDDIYASDGKLFASVYHKSSVSETLANAEFIVRACNAHQALYEALSALLLECGLAAISGEPLQKDNEKVVQARAAIKLAEVI